MQSDKVGPIVAVGSFDGVHLGHRQILSRTMKLAEQFGATTAVLTFDPLPAQLVHPDFTFVLTPLAEKAALFLELGIATVHVVRFDSTVQAEEPDVFVHKHLFPLSPAAVVVGHDHRFGRARKGNIELLSRLLEAARVRLEVVPEFLLDGVPVRSTVIREHLLLGHVRRAALLLGRPYSIAGRVVPGHGTGRRLGFPTLNIQVQDREKLVPADGVYAVWADIEGCTQPAVMNIGHRPTFGGEKRSIEVHLLDERLEMPPLAAAIHFVERLRPERKFSDLSALAARIAEDVALARRILAG